MFVKKIRKSYIKELLAQHSMKNIKKRSIAISYILLFFYIPSSAQGAVEDSISEPTDSIKHLACYSSGKHSFIHQIGAEIRPGAVFQTNDFLRGYTEPGKEHRYFYSLHFKYAIQFKPHTLVDRVFQGTYQGVGFNYYNFGDKRQLGNPMSVYLFQGARIAQLNPRLSFNYEWNLGLSWGWKHYDYDTNPNNVVIGSKLNAYINAAFYLKWMLSRQFDLTTGVDLTHFSNGNTEIPNGGLNLIDFKLGVVYNFNREEDKAKQVYTPLVIPDFKSHITYDFLLFGSWRRKGVVFGDKKIASPDKYNVWGFNFAPMYNLCYRFRTGLSIDGVCDTSSNATAEDAIVAVGDDPKPDFCRSSIREQLALGISGRAEYVMPYFAINLGIGFNVLHGGSDLKSVYEVLALKTEVTKNLYLHIGYTLQNFHSPNYLMFGIGFRFNNPTAKIYR